MGSTLLVKFWPHLVIYSYLPNSTLQLDLYDMSQTESGVRRRKSYDDLCDLQFVPYEASRLFFKAFTDSAITVFCDNLFHGVITR